MGLRIEVLKEEVAFNNYSGNYTEVNNQLNNQLNSHVTNNFSANSGKINIKVVGSGSGGCNAINQMIKENISGVDFIAVNTDMQALDACKAGYKIAIGQNLTKGLGAGGNPEIGSSAAYESKSDLEKVLEGANMVFLTTGLGGGTGTGSLPVIASIAKKTGALVVAIVTMPFSFDGARKMEIAQTGLDELREHIDALIVIPNEKLLKIADKRATMLDLFAKANDLLRIGVQGIVNLVNFHGHMNVDFNDVKSVMGFGGDAIMGEGRAKGDNRAVDALKNALNSPLVERGDIDGAKGLLVNVTTGKDFAMAEYAEIMSELDKRIDTKAIRKNGWVIEPNLGDEVHVTIIATGFCKNEKQENVVRNFKTITATPTNPTINHKDYSNNSSNNNATSPNNNFANATQNQKVAKNAKDMISSDEWENILNNSTSSYDNNNSSADLDDAIPSYLRLKR